MTAEILFWHWWVLGLGLLIAEILLPSTFCLWLGLSAFVTGAIAWFVPTLAWPIELVLFAVLSFVALALWFKFKPMSKAAPDTGLNQRGRGYIGQVYELVEPVHNGFGKVRVEDTVWRVTGPDAPLGTRVRVVAVDGSTLRIEPVERSA